MRSSKTPSSCVMISEKAQIVPGAPTTLVYLAFPVRFFPAGVYCRTQVSYPPAVKTVSYTHLTLPTILLV